jgi:iron complex outermembrane receptor protein
LPPLSFPSHTTAAIGRSSQARIAGFDRSDSLHEDLFIISGIYHMKTALFRSVAFVALLAPTAAFAQSTGSIDFEEESTIVVTGTRSDRDVGGVIAPDTSKAKQVLTQEAISRANPGQTILDTINVIPGVNFQNNDAYGSSGGTLTIRGFSSDRISLTFDGVPLNDSGNYAIYSNQQLDPELIEQVNVNLGSTDIDSATASGIGATVNYRTINPSEEYGAMLSASYGEFDFFRVFGKIETGAFGPFGTRAFISASKATNDNPYNNYGKVYKQQYNAKIYQPIGSNGDFVSVAGNYNQNRNNFFGSVRLRNDRPVPEGFPQTKDQREYDINYPCSVSTVATPGVADFTNGCGTEFDRRYNPSNTGNIRGASRFTLTDQLTFTVDPSYQYVKANGGGTTNARERLNRGLAGYMGGRPYFGMDLNGDGDLLDEVTVLTPSQTRTHRFLVIAGLRYDINDDNTFRLSYTYDRANHRQTGQVGFLQSNGEPVDVFAINVAQNDVTGAQLNKRDRQSYAILNKVSAEYRGDFLDNKLTVNLGVAAPFFTRDLQQNCFTTSASGFVDCFGEGDPRNAAYAAANPTVQGPQKRKLKYDKILPSAGLIYRFTDAVSAFANYSMGFSPPATDNLYNSFFYAPGTAQAQPKPETSDTFDGGLRYRSRQVQAQVGGYFTKYSNRTASSYDPILEASVFRNIGSVDKYGVDGYVSYAPVPQLVLYAFGSYNDSEIKDNVQTGATSAGDPIFAPTAGKSESGAPKYSYGGTVRGLLGPVELGLTAKRTGKRFVYDTNLPVMDGATQVFPSAAPAYWLVNADARFSFERYGLEKTYIQLNVYNLFNKLYVGGFGGGLSQTGSPPFVQIGVPRTISGTLVVGF